MSSRAITLIKEIFPDFSITEKDFKNPSQEFLMKFCEKFFDECCILDLRLQTPPDVLHPESLNDALPIISTRAFLSYISSHIKGPQVGLEDIIDPNPKKTWSLLDILTNYLAYVDCHSGKFPVIAHENAIQAVAEKEELTKEIDEIKEKLNEIAIRKAESASELKKLDNKVLENAEIRDSVKEQCVQIEEELKIKSNTLSEERLEICALEKEIEKELEEIERLKEQIVSSPDTVTRKIAELTMKKKDMESDQALLRNRAKQTMLLNSNLEQISSMIQSKLPQVDELATNLKFLRDLENGLIEDEAAVKSAKEKYDTVAGKCQENENDIAHINEEIANFKVKSIEEQVSLEESIQQALKQKAEAEQKQIEHGAQQVVIAQKIHQLKEEIADVEKEGRDFIKFFNQMEERMYEMVRNFRNSLHEEAEKILQNE